MSTPTVGRGFMQESALDSDKDGAFPSWYWALVPLLAVAAFAPVLTLWFAGDDFNLLYWHERQPGLVPFSPSAGIFYRPISGSLTWNLGYSLFGTNALPYHIVSLALHALIALSLAKAVAAISGEARLGWVSGAIFAVFPLSTEPVAWLAAQWDLWAAICAVAGVWAFAVAWRRRDWRPYAAGLAAVLVGVFMKESILPLPLVLPFVALATELSPSKDGPSGIPEWRSLAGRALLWSVPYAVPSLIFVGLRLLTYGSIGGYATAKTNYQHFVWDAMVVAALEMLMPLNRRVFSQTAVQLVGLFTTGIFLVGLTLWGRRRWPLLLLAAVWWLAFVAPVTSLVLLDNPTTLGNRILYLSLMGFCIALAALLSVLMDLGRRRVIEGAFMACLLLAVPITWIQLQPWQQASRQNKHILQEIAGLATPAQGKIDRLHIKSLPTEYKGAYVVWDGLDDALGIFNHRPAIVKEVDVLDPQTLVESLAADSGGSYNLKFYFDPTDELYHISELAGVLLPMMPPTSEELTWDYTACNEERPSQQVEWQPFQASFYCVPESQLPPFPGTFYAVLQPVSPDPNISLPDLRVDVSNARWVRLAVLARLPGGDKGVMGEWFWGTSEEPRRWSASRHDNFMLDADRKWRTYLTYIRAEDIGTELNGLRFDSVNSQVRVDIAWISITTFP